MERPVLQLDPNRLYTAESVIFENAPVSNKPIFVGRDKNDIYYVTDGNHRASCALKEGKTVDAIVVTEGNFSVLEDPDFRRVSELRQI